MSSGPKITPMLAQYLEIKRQVADCILFYRMGDFYEMFFEDAVRASPVLDVQLTSRDKNAEQPIPMCGVPHHAAETYIQKLISKGLKVALCEQMEMPGSQKGIVRREVVRIITPALVGDPNLVPETATRLLMVLREDDNGFEVVAIDMLAGRVWNQENMNALMVADCFLKWRPQELLLQGDLKAAHPLFDGVRQSGVTITIRPSYFEGHTTLEAANAYVRETHGERAVSLLAQASSMAQPGVMRLDPIALSALEILESRSGEAKGSLVERVEHCETAMGRRMLREWLAHPLVDPALVQERLDAVEYFVNNSSKMELVGIRLRGMRDLERLATKAALGLAQPTDLVAICCIQKKIPDVTSQLAVCDIVLFKKLAQRLDTMSSLTTELEQALEDNPPAMTKWGGVIRESYRPEIAELRNLSKNAKELVFELEKRERSNTGISSLKVRYNRVFGYGIEVTKAQLPKVPSRFIRRQTLANGERYVTPELRGLEEKIQSADEKLCQMEERLFIELRERVAGCHRELKQNASTLAEIDAILSFAVVAREGGYTKPHLTNGSELVIINGRHPVIECLVPPGSFVPNTITMQEEECRTLLITGPNMAGKSTIMRQVALIAVLAQCGSYVPAERAILPLFDAIFTRIGSSDNLARGQSTFMVEMTEMARIVSQATPRSLILVDEVGRGTSTYDGLSLAWSLLEYLHQSVKARTLFATHFHELTSLEGVLAALKNVSVLVENNGGEIVFLHRLATGACSRSYGVEVARLAGLPPKILLRAKELLCAFESQAQRGDRGRYRALQAPDKQMGFLGI